jgi:hypothetical protein
LLESDFNCHYEDDKSSDKELTASGTQNVPEKADESFPLERITLACASCEYLTVEFVQSRSN